MTDLDLRLGDCREQMRDLPDESVDAVVTDPPYELGFMGNSWDAAGVSFQPETWAECLRVLKPGGHLLAFGGTRTVHRIAVAIEDGGFEIRDLIAWMYGSGFPKSLNLDGEWKGWGTALKPALEPIIVARKPLTGTVAANVSAYGTGALNINECRVAFVSDEDEDESKSKNRHGDFGTPQGGNEVYGDYSMIADRENYDPPGRWPANIALSHSPDCVLVGETQVASDGHFPTDRPGTTEITTKGHSGQEGLSERYMRGETVAVWACVPGCPIRTIDDQSGITRSSGGANGGKLGERVYGKFANQMLGENAGGLGDVGGASRFFYCAKTSRSERSAGLDASFEERLLRWSSGDESPGTFQSEGTDKSTRNHHPTVKPIDLMRWLLRLVTPPDGIVLDPFLGSGSTGCAAMLEPAVGRFIGIEREDDYLVIARARIAFWQEHGEEALDVVRVRGQSEERRRDIADAGQLDLLHELAPDS